MGTENHPAVPLQQVMNSGQGGPQPLVVRSDGFNPLFDRHVEINPYQDFLASDIQAGKATFAHKLTNSSFWTELRWASNNPWNVMLSRNGVEAKHLRFFVTTLLRMTGISFV